MLRIVTKDSFFPEEKKWLEKILSKYPAEIHLRKPDSGQYSFVEFFSSFPESFRKRMWIHQHHEACAFLSPLGFHIPVRKRKYFQDHLKNKFFQKNKMFRLSFSLHAEDNRFIVDPLTDSVLISPIWDSISKSGYSGKKMRAESFLLPPSVQRIALGGITEKNVRQTLELGYDGIAVCGHVWNSNHPLDAVGALYEALKKFFASNTATS